MAAGGGRRKGRKPTRAEQDDRPRGYESQRMRQLWRDIDESKHKAGIGARAEPPPAPGWDLTGVVECATALAGDVVAWVSSTVPSACAVIAGAAALLRDVPVLGRIAGLMSTGPAAPAPSAPARSIDPHELGSTTNGAHPDRRGGDPNGEWIH